MGSSRTRDRTFVSCIGRWTLYHRATGEAQVGCLGARGLFLPSEAELPAADSRGHTVFKTPLICFSAAVPTQGELGGRKPSPLEPDPAVEPAEPDASRTEPGEQGAVPRRTEAIHVRGPGDGGAC